MLSAYRENILILSEHVQILGQIFDSEVIRNYLYLSNPKWVKKKNCTRKKNDIPEQYWMGNFLEKWQGYFVFTIFLLFSSEK